MNETRKTRLIEELALIVADDIKNNKDSYVCIMSKDFNLTETARNSIIYLNKSFLTRFVSNISDLHGVKHISVASYEERITLGSLLDHFKSRKSRIS